MGGFEGFYSARTDFRDQQVRKMYRKRERGRDLNINIKVETCCKISEIIN